MRVVRRKQAGHDELALTKIIIARPVFYAEASVRKSENFGLRILANI